MTSENISADTLFEMGSEFLNKIILLTDCSAVRFCFNNKNIKISIHNSIGFARTQ